MKPTLARDFRIGNIRNQLMLLTLGGIIFSFLPKIIYAQAANFPSPQVRAALGTKDSAALSEIAAYSQATGAGNWQDLEANGTLSFPKGGDYPAELDLRGAEFSRFDIAMDSGVRSVRVQKLAGQIQDEHGNRAPLLASTSSRGLVAFPRVWTRAAGSPLVSLYDQGAYTVFGASLHRVTMEYPLDEQSRTPGRRTIATDLYFDPSSHLLLYSVDAVRLRDTRGQALMRVTSYADYSQFSGVSVPTQIQQWLNGQLQWTLRITRTIINSNPPVTVFTF